MSSKKPKDTAETLREPQEPSARLLAQWPDDSVVYTTANGVQVCGDSRDLLDLLPDSSIDLVLTSPPFALLRKKAYGNEDQEEYVDWLADFGRRVHRVLKPTGSFVVDLGGAYRKGSPTRSLYQYRVLIKFVDELKFHLAEEFFWHNPAKLPSPIEWVNKRKIRVKDSVNCVWWFSKEEFPKADVKNVLRPYSNRMGELLQDPQGFYDPKKRPSEHAISEKFAKDNGGAIPPNLLEFPNTDSNSHYIRTCRAMGVDSHPARFPERLPEFFIRFLTDPGDVVLDIFSGSNTTGFVAEREGRSWLAFELDREYAALSGVRFCSGLTADETGTAYKEMRDGAERHLGTTS